MTNCKTERQTTEYQFRLDKIDKYTTIINDLVLKNKHKKSRPHHIGLIFHYRQKIKRINEHL